MSFDPLVYPPSTRLGTPPNHTPLGERLEDRTDPLAPTDHDHGYAHAHLSEALSRGLIQLQQVFDPEDGTPPFTPLLDPQTCPAWGLPWLAQLVGASIPQTATEDQARQIITGLASHRRGTTSMLEAAAGLYLTGNKTVYFRERDGGDPYRLEVVTLDSETADPDAVRAALQAQKPGGIVLVYREVAGWDYQAMTAAGGTYAQLSAAFSSYANLAHNEPG